MSREPMQLQEPGPRRRSGWIVTLAVCGLGLLLVPGFLWQERCRLQGELDELRLLRKEESIQLAGLQDRIRTLRGKVEEVAGSESEMLRTIGVQPLVPDGGQGPYETRSIFARTMEAREKELRRQLWLEVERLAQETQRIEELDGDLRRFIQERAALISAVPALRPIKGGRVTSKFGVRSDPFTEESKMHWGLDLAHRPGTPVMAAAEGSVSQAGWDGAFGRTVRVDHGFGFSTIYAHLQEIRVGVGDRIGKGDVLGLLGSSGRTTGNHLHYEVRVEGRRVNPMYFLREDVADLAQAQS